MLGQIGPLERLDDLLDRSWPQLADLLQLWPEAAEGLPRRSGDGEPLVAMTAPVMAEKVPIWPYESTGRILVDHGEWVFDPAQHDADDPYAAWQRGHD